MKHLLVLALAFFASGASAVLPKGGDSSAGGGGGYLSLATGYNAGKFDISAFGPQDSVLAEVLKYYDAGGARAEENSVMQSWEVPGQEADHAMMHQKSISPTSNQYYQLNVRLDYLDLLQIRAFKSGTRMQFRGSLAQVLFKGMEKAGAPLVSPPDLNGNYTQRRYASAHVECSERSNAPLDCEIRF